MKETETTKKVVIIRKWCPYLKKKKSTYEMAVPDPEIYQNVPENI